MNTIEVKENRGEDQTKMWVKSIGEDVSKLTAARESDDQAAQKDVEKTINETPLSVEVRSGWYDLCNKDADKKPAEFCILLSTGGPACRIIGELSEHGEPTSARIQHQDWGTPWTNCWLDQDEETALLAFAACFYFGE
jgi:hypothetical protein